MIMAAFASLLGCAAVDAICSQALADGMKVVGKSRLIARDEAQALVKRCDCVPGEGMQSKQIAIEAARQSLWQRVGKMKLHRSFVLMAAFASLLGCAAIDANYSQAFADGMKVVGKIA